jgi:hypothetical protein
VRWPFIDDLITEAFEQNGRPCRSFCASSSDAIAEQLRGGEQGYRQSLWATGLLLIDTRGGELRAYSRQSTIIADESRLLEVDTAGRVVWSTENTQLDFYTGSIVSSKARYPITPNARVYRYGENELLIVEPERNRVAIIDRAGAEDPHHHAVHP